MARRKVGSRRRVGRTAKKLLIRRTKRICSGGIVCLSLFCGLAGNAKAETGLVTKRVSGCDYFIIDAPSGYVVAEWYGGHDPYLSEKVVGAFNSFGFMTFFYGSESVEGRVYIEDYGLDEDDALEKLSEQCN